jgi:hypothetical protein
MNEEHNDADFIQRLTSMSVEEYKNSAYGKSVMGLEAYTILKLFRRSRSRES